MLFCRHAFTATVTFATLAFAICTSMATEAAVEKQCSFTEIDESFSTSRSCLLQVAKESMRGVPQANFKSILALVQGKVDHHPTAAAACDTCKEYHSKQEGEIGSGCYVGPCNDNSGDYCWSDEKLDGFEEC
mmetsp:Transcript_114055/g.179546  ORF Transcript_114055/g.179546 Transcript_114055/m.179546 type:complete len:132 (-) Transcript_114055:65-460(-)